jgi:FeS assembly SUF system protein
LVDEKIIRLTDENAARAQDTARGSTAEGSTAATIFERRDPVKTLTMTPKIVDVLATIFDPEIPVNVYELGLIYDIAVDAGDAVGVRMTLTAPGCPAAQTLPVEVASKLKAMPGVSDARVDVVWDPPWDKDRMSEAAKLQLGMF